MKKFILVLTAFILSASLFGCGIKKECDFCGEEKFCKTKTIFGQEANVCNDCLKEMAEFMGR